MPPTEQVVIEKRSPNLPDDIDVGDHASPSSVHPSSATAPVTKNVVDYRASLRQR